jgi:hypothetical protein
MGGVSIGYIEKGSSRVSGDCKTFKQLFSVLKDQLDTLNQRRIATG